MFFRARKATSVLRRDWADEIADFIERAIDTARDRAVVPLTTIARGIVYGFLACVLGISALVLTSILFVRIADIYLDNIPGIPDGVWMADLVSGGIFVVLGVYLWTLRTAKPRKNEE